MNQWTDKLEDYNKLRAMMTQIAEKNDLQLNPDAKRTEKVLSLMTNNLAKTGLRICPCKQSHPINPEADVVCPCPTWKDEITESGSCHCKLFCAKD